MYDGYDYWDFIVLLVIFVSIWFCCSDGGLLLKAATYVLLVLLLFSSWFGGLNFTDKFWICFFGICSPYFSWQYLRVFFLSSCWIVSSWFLLTCSLIVLYSVEGMFDWSFESISFISYSVSLIVVSQNFYSHLHQLFCAFILDFIPLVNKLLILIPYGGFKIDF